MGNLTETSTWEANVYQWEKTDIVEGGADGLDNVPLRQLANRTLWLKDAQRGFIDVTTISASKTLTVSDVLQKLVIISAINAPTAQIICTLPELLDWQKGTRVQVMAYGVVKQVTIRSTSANIIISKNPKNNLYMGDGDSLELVWTGDLWVVIGSVGNFATVGRPDYGYSVMPNTVVANGQLLNRVDYPRLWEYVSTLPQGVVSDTIWQNTTGYKGFYSLGNNSTTFRVPDLRSMFLRGLDIGAGIAFGRNVDQPGGYEADTFKAHAHKHGGESLYDLYHDDNPDLETPNGELVSTNKTWQTVPQRSDTYVKQLTQKVGKAETRPKNIGLIPLIYV